MTANQIAYWNLQETKRSNLAKESETSRHNLATEGKDLATLQETSAHNRATESIAAGQLGEQIRHNVSTETIDISRLNETARHNKASEELTAQSNYINQWYNETIAGLRKQELNLQQQKELQRIVESQRDYNEAVRQYDVNNAHKAVSTGATAVNAITGNNGIIPTIALGSTLYAGSKLYKAAQAAQTAKYADKLANTPKISSTFMILPEASLDIFKASMIGTDTGSVQYR